MPQFHRSVVVAVQRNPLAARASHARLVTPCTGGRPLRVITINDQHCRAAQNAVGGHHQRRMCPHELLVQQNPPQRHGHRQDDQQIPGKAGPMALAVRPPQDDQCRPYSRSGQSEPSQRLQALPCKQHSTCRQDDRHRSHHERSVADCGDRKPVKLDKKLHRNTEKRGYQQHTPLRPI